MKYNSLLKDLLVGEPTLIQKAPTERETDEDRAKRFKLMEDKFLKKPRVLLLIYFNIYSFFILIFIFYPDR
jgi:hypothetical protein